MESEKDEDVEDDLQEFKACRWRQKANNREEWASAVKGRGAEGP
jgi:hypothetical protein